MAFHSVISKHTPAMVFAAALVLPPLWSFMMLKPIFPKICSKRPHHRIKQASP